MAAESAESKKISEKKRKKLIARAEERAADYYRREKFFCSEAVLYTINDLLGEPLPREVVSLASGFPVGIGKSKCLCGAVSGGVMALGIKYGREKPGAEMPEESFTYSAALHDFIIKEYGSTCCRVLTAGFTDFSSQERAEHCIEITGMVAGWVTERLIEGGAFNKVL